jgi:hypothetical protein
MAENALIAYLLGKRKEQDKLAFGGRENAPIPPRGYTTEMDYNGTAYGVPGVSMDMPQAIGAGFMPSAQPMPRKPTSQMTIDELAELLSDRQKYAEALIRAQGQ